MTPSHTVSFLCSLEVQLTKKHLVKDRFDFPCCDSEVFVEIVVLTEMTFTFTLGEPQFSLEQVLEMVTVIVERHVAVVSKFHSVLLYCRDKDLKRNCLHG